MTKLNILHELNPQQRAAAESDARVTKVEAGAGTGKTKMLIGRIQHLLDDNRDRTLFVSFSNAAVEEIQRRVEPAVDDFNQKLVEVKTCHAMGNRLVMTHYRELGYKDRPKLVKDWELADAYIDHCKTNGYAVREGNILKACLSLEAFALACNKPIDDEFIQEHGGVLSGHNRQRRVGKWSRGSSKPRWTEDMVKDQLEKLQVFRRKVGYLLFQDMIAMPLQLDPEAFKIFNAGHVLVDEVQDLNYAQHRFINLLQKDSFTLTMVGDESQSIFGFQGAQPEVFRNIQVLYPQAQVFKLETNYRCDQPILDLANSVLKKELESDICLVPDKPRPGIGVQVYRDQNATIVEWIHNVMEEQKRAIATWQPTGELGEEAPTLDYSETAILFRAHRHTPLLEMVLTNAEIPYNLQGKSFFEEPVVEDLLAYFQFFSEKPFSTKYDNSWTKIIRHKKFLGKKTEDEARETAKMSGNDILTHYTGRTGGVPAACRTHNQRNLFQELLTDLEEAEKLHRDQNWYELARLAYNLAEDSWEDRFSSDPWQLKEAVDKANGFIDWVRNVTDTTGRAPMEVLKEHQERAQAMKGTKSKDGVRILTVHGAKGLEWDNVALWNVGPSTFPLGYGEPREERRLCYVGITRARRNLGLFINPEADKVTVDYLTGTATQANWSDHPILKHVGQDVNEFLAAIRD